MQFPPRSTWVLLALGAVACGFEDPAAIPPAPSDACQTGSAEPDQLYASYAQNPAINCETMTTDENALNTVIYFTGIDWNKAGVECRAVDPFHGGLMISDSRPPTSETIDIQGSLAYCVVGPGSGSEYIVYSLCGILEPAMAGCELLSTMTSIPTKFESCPGGPLCP